MSRVLVTGSADGLGRRAAQTLLEEGHEVVVHVRSEERRSAVDDLGAPVVVGDLASEPEVRALAERVNALGRLDAVIHNAGVIRGPDVMAVNVVAPYLLTALVERPQRLIYLSSSMHRGGRPDLSELDGGSYSDSKLLVTTLALAVARLWPDVISHAVDPGWVPTRMGGAGATDDLRLGHLTQEWLATSDDPEVLESGGYWYHQQRRRPEVATTDPAFQDRLLAELARRTGETLAR